MLLKAIIHPKVLSNSLSLAFPCSFHQTPAPTTLSHCWSTDSVVNFICPYPPPIRRRLRSHHRCHKPNHHECCHPCLLLPYLPSNDDAADDDNDGKIVELDIVELLAEHIHFCQIRAMEHFLALCHVFPGIQIALPLQISGFTPPPVLWCRRRCCALPILVSVRRLQ